MGRMNQQNKCCHLLSTQQLDNLADCGHKRSDMIWGRRSIREGISRVKLNEGLPYSPVHGITIDGDGHSGAHVERDLISDSHHQEIGESQAMSYNPR